MGILSPLKMTEKRTVPSTPRTAPSSLGDMRDCQKLELTLPHWRMTKLSGGVVGGGGDSFPKQSFARFHSQERDTASLIGLKAEITPRSVTFRQLFPPC